MKLATEPTKAVNLEIQAIERYDMNTVMGIVNTVKERDITDVVLGIHQRTTPVDSFFGSKVDELLCQLNKMVIITRCYIPINTISRMVVAVPPKAEYETGFELWVIRMSNMAMRIGCRLTFYAAPETIPYIKGVIHKHKYEFRREYKEMNGWDDFITLTKVVREDDLFVVVSARRTSISYSSDLEALPNFLSKYYGHSNLIVVFPEQFGAAPNLESFSDPIATDIDTQPSEIVLRAKEWWRGMSIRMHEFLTRPRGMN